MQAPTHHGFTFNSRFLRARGQSPSLWKYATFSFWLSHFFEVYIFVQEKSWTLTLKRHNSFQNKNNRKPHSVLLLELWFLSCSKNFENSTICLPELDLLEKWTGEELFKLGKSKFWVRHFFSIATLSKHLTWFYLITYNLFF